MKRLIPLTLAFILAQCHAQMALHGNSYNLVPDCGPRGCGVSYFVNYLGRQDFTEYGFYEGKFYYRHAIFLTRG